MSRRDVANGVGSNITGSPDQRFEGREIGLKPSEESCIDFHQSDNSISGF